MREIAFRFLGNFNKVSKLELIQFGSISGQIFFSLWEKWSDALGLIFPASTNYLNWKNSYFLSSVAKRVEWFRKQERNSEKELQSVQMKSHVVRSFPSLTSVFCDLAGDAATALSILVNKNSSMIQFCILSSFPWKVALFFYRCHEASA